MFRKFFQHKAPSTPQGQRAYAIGDVHGRADLLAALIAAVQDDDTARGLAQSTFILLGDLINRGPDSAGVLALARQWQEQCRAIILMGNHEEMLLDLPNRPWLLKYFLRYGGQETAQSYGLTVDAVGVEAWPSERYADTAAAIFTAIGKDDLALIASFCDSYALGDYGFAHAGIKPGVAFDRQVPADLRWIREPFLKYRKAHDHCIIHGHTITEDADIRPNRIGIDTGAYQSDILTALGLEGTHRWLIQARGDRGTINITRRSIT